MNHENITIYHALCALHAARCLFLHARWCTHEYAAGHLQGARNLDWLNPAAFEKGLQGLDKSRTYFVYCRSGKRSNAAAKRMKREGFKVYDLSGGYLKWTEQALPITK